MDGRITRIAAAGLSGFVALLAAVAAAFGIFARGDGAFETVTSARGEIYEMATTGIYAYNARQLVAEGVGWDIFTLVVAAPALGAAALLVARGSFRGLLVAGGMLGYFAYMHLEYAMTWALGPLFPVFIAVFGASVLGLAAVAAGITHSGMARRFDDRFPRRSWAALSIGLAALLTIMWSARIAGALGAETPALAGETTMTVQALDLGLVMPVAILTASLALRRVTVGLVASAAFAITFVGLCAAITSMLVSVAAVTGVVEWPPIVLFATATALGAWLATRIYGSATGVPDRQALRAELNDCGVGAVTHA